MKSFINFIGWTMSFIFNYKVIKHIKKFKSLVWWYSVKRNLKSIGTNSVIEYPSILIGEKYLDIGNNFNAPTGTRIEAYDSYMDEKFSPQIIIGDNVNFNYDCHIGCCNKVIIGNNVLFASRVFVTDHFHGKVASEELEVPPALRSLYSKGIVTIEDNVWIGENVCVMPGVTIGENSIIGANSVVTHSIPSNSVAVGSPAKVIRSL